MIFAVTAEYVEKRPPALLMYSKVCNFQSVDVSEDDHSVSGDIRQAVSLSRELRKPVVNTTVERGVFAQPYKPDIFLFVGFCQNVFLIFDVARPCGLIGEHVTENAFSKPQRAIVDIHGHIGRKFYRRRDPVCIAPVARIDLGDRYLGLARRFDVVYELLNVKRIVRHCVYYLRYDFFRIYRRYFEVC